MVVMVAAAREYTPCIVPSALNSHKHHEADTIFSNRLVLLPFQYSIRLKESSLSGTDEGQRHSGGRRTDKKGKCVTSACRLPSRPRELHTRNLRGSERSAT